RRGKARPGGVAALEVRRLGVSRASADFSSARQGRRQRSSASEKVNLARLYERGFGARNELTRSDALRAEFEPQGAAAIGKFERQTRRRSLVSVTSGRPAKERRCFQFEGTRTRFEHSLDPA